MPKPPTLPKSYDLLAILLHWVMAALIFGLFFLGEWMVDLDYYHPWYHRAPDLHRSLGVVAGLLLVVRLGWRLGRGHPPPLGRPWERRLALWLHRAFYLLIAGAVLAGYLISTAEGQGVSVFGWFEIPATLWGIEQQADIAGLWHEVLTHVLFFLAIAHGLAALKHHFIDRDATLLRMLRPGASSANHNATEE